MPEKKTSELFSMYEVRRRNSLMLDCDAMYTIGQDKRQISCMKHVTNRSAITAKGGLSSGDELSVHERYALKFKFQLVIQMGFISNFWVSVSLWSDLMRRFNHPSEERNLPHGTWSNKGIIG